MLGSDGEVKERSGRREDREDQKEHHDDQKGLLTCSFALFARIMEGKGHSNAARMRVARGLLLSICIEFEYRVFVQLRQKDISLGRSTTRRYQVESPISTTSRCTLTLSQIPRSKYSSPSQPWPASQPKPQSKFFD